SYRPGAMAHGPRTSPDESSTTNALRSSWLINPRQIHSFKEVLVSSVLESVMPSTDDILAATAHELRLPLSHIKGFVTSLRRTDVEWDDETRKEFIREIDLETDRLAELIDSLLSARPRKVSSAPAVDLAFTSPGSVIQRAR